MTSTSGSQHRCVFVGNIPYDATEEQLIQICEEVGPVVSFRLVLDKETGRPKGYGFCEYKDEETALSARRNLQGYEINGRQLRVDFAENDKGVDRNREQGRGGPGFASATDSHKSLSGPPFVGDGALHQPLGFPLAAAAASLMAEAFGGPQMTSNLPKFGNGMPNVPDSSYDPLTAHLAKMSRQHLYEVLSEMKALVTRNRAQARQLLQESPQLTKALLQAQIILGMATPQMILAAGIQKTSSAVAKYSGQDNKHDLAPYIGYVTSNNEAGIETFLRPSEGQENHVLPDSAIIPQSSLPPKPIPFHVYRPHMPQNQVSVQGMIPGIGGAYMHSNIQAPPLTTSRCSLSQVQPSLMYHSRPVGTPNIIHQSQGIQPHTSMHQSSLPPLTSQITLNQPVLLSGVEMLSNDVRSSGSNLHLSCVSRISSQPSSADFVLQNEMPSGTTELLNHTSKRRRLEEGGIVHNFIGGKSSLPGISSSQPSDSSLLAGREISNTDGLQKTHQQMPQLSAAEESALLQQLLSLTAEQLSSLPLEQQQQVFEIQNTLRSKPHI